MSPSIRIRSVIDEIVNTLEQGIINHEFKPGQRLVESALIAEWNVSRTSLREAFRLLEGEGFIEHKPRRGVFVSPLMPEQVRNIYQVRAELEGLVLKLAILNADEEFVQKLKDLDVQMNAAYRDDDLEKYAVLNRMFHDEILKRSQNDFLISILNSTHKKIERCMSYFRPGHQGESNKSHASIIRFFETKDHERAKVERTQRILAMGEFIVNGIMNELKKGGSNG